MPWRARLGREALALSTPEFDLLLHVSLRPAFPPEYDVPGLVAVTFRLHERREGGHRYVTAIDLPAALHLGARFGLDAAESLAFVDSHERMHVFLQMEGVPEEVEEAHSRFVDAVWLSFRHPRAAELVAAGEGGLVVRVHEDFWEELIDAAARPPLFRSPGDEALFARDLLRRPMGEYGLLGKLTAAPGQRAALVDILLEAAALLKDAPGCRQWLVHEAVAEPDAVWITEIWRTREDHDASLTRPDVRALIGRAMPLLAGPPQAGHETVPRGGVGA